MVLAGEIALPAGDVGEPFVNTDDIADVAVAALTDARPPRPAPPSADQMLPPGSPPPAGHGRGLDDVERVAAAREEPREEAPEQAIVAAQPAPGEPPTFLHHQLVAERDVLHERIDACQKAPSHTGPPAIVGTRYRRILEADRILGPTTWTARGSSAAATAPLYLDQVPAKKEISRA